MLANSRVQFQECPPSHLTRNTQNICAEAHHTKTLIVSSTHVRVQINLLRAGLEGPGL